MISTQRLRALGPAVLSTVVLAACTHNVNVAPIKVEPIDITLHIYLEADEKLDEFFGDAQRPAKEPAASTSPGREPTQGAK